MGNQNKKDKDHGKTQFGANELKQLVDSFLNGSIRRSEIWFNEPLVLSRSTVYYLFEKPRKSAFNWKWEKWTETIIYDQGKITLEYEPSDDENKYMIYRIVMQKD